MLQHRSKVLQSQSEELNINNILDFFASLVMTAKAKVPFRGFRGFLRKYLEFLKILLIFVAILRFTSAPARWSANRKNVTKDKLKKDFRKPHSGKRFYFLYPVFLLERFSFFLL